MPLRTGAAFPSLQGATEWINGPEPAPEELTSRPTLVHFWAVSCPLCHDNMPAVARWREQYGATGLRVVAVHMPREESDTDLSRVRSEAAALGITEPCAVDNRHAIGERFENSLWPAYYLFDADGALRARSGGYAGITMLEARLAKLMESGDEANGTGSSQK